MPVEGQHVVSQDDCSRFAASDQYKLGGKENKLVAVCSCVKYHRPIKPSS